MGARVAIMPTKSSFGAAKVAPCAWYLHIQGSYIFFLQFFFFF